MSSKEVQSIAPATGKLGVMVVGLGAVATTMIAGVEAVRRGLGLADLHLLAGADDPDWSERCLPARVC